MRDHIDFLLNGEPVSLAAADAGRTVLAWLREERRLTGTKEGCAEGDCGACTAVVLERTEAAGVVHRPVNTCIQFLGALDGRALVTVEGIGRSGDLHPAQQAMVDCHGSQCGFCTPGFVMALYAHYQEPRLPLADALAGNLCRCTGYAPILAAGERMSALPAVSRNSSLEEALARLPVDGVESEAFAAPRTLAELDRALERGGVVLGGGTDLGLAVTKQLRELGRIVYVGHVRELRGVREAPGHLEIGAATPLADAAGALGGLHPDIAELLRRFGGPQVRACGTLGGNIANGSPIGDSMPVLLALDATLLLHAAKEEREVKVADFYTGYRRTVLRPDEIVRAIRVPRLKAGERFAAYKVSKRFDQDISAVCGAFYVGVGGEPRFAFGGMAATPARARRTEAAWPKGLEAACAALAEDFSPLSDQRGSSGYRRRIAGSLLRKFAAGVSSRAIFEIA